MLNFSLPSNSELHDPSLRFMESCGLPVDRPSSRRYTGSVAGLPQVQVLFQRSADIPTKVEEGSADLGIVGLERFYEDRREGGPAITLLEDLGYGQCELVVAVPDAWIDVTSVADLADLSVAWREQGRELRVVTKYARLVSRFFYRHGVNYFSLVEAAGAMEVAPTMGYADVIVDITATGVTLRENRLKMLSDGTLVRAQACLIGNRLALKEDPAKLEATRVILERFEARRRASKFVSLTSNLRGESEASVAERVTRLPDLAGLQGPTVGRVFGKGYPDQGWYAVTVVIPRERLMPAVEHLRTVGGSGITVASPSFLFEGECEAYQRLLQELARG
ncbi:MAG: ATP phosphoribosyltransferase [Chloroflexi bacterium]|nr:ATP phosphoribosyltransferase [Chloroflexota bacterium]